MAKDLGVSRQLIGVSLLVLVAATGCGSGDTHAGNGGALGGLADTAGVDDRLAAGHGGAPEPATGGALGDLAGTAGVDDRLAAGNGGAPESATGGAPSGLAGAAGVGARLAAGNGGAPEPATGGAPGSQGGAGDSGGRLTAGEGGAAGDDTTPGGSANGGTEAGSAGSSGAPDNSGGAAGQGGNGSAGAGPMTYGIPGQSCQGDLSCPGQVSCCTQMELPEGSFLMGTSSDPARSTDEAPEHTAVLDAFFLDKFEVTVGRFRRFVDAFDGTLPSPGSGALPGQADSGWQAGFDSQLPASQADLIAAINCDTSYFQTWSELAGASDALPMNCVSWYVAFAFCLWDGGRLPTEAEWEKAAANGSSESRFPWGAADPDPATHAVMNCLGDGTAACDPSDLLPVGSRPAGANTWGHLDLAGSLWEWTLDYYNATYYQTIGTCDNCTNQAGTTPRVVRGGDFSAILLMLRATARASQPPTSINPYTGFRCARSL